MAYVAKVANVNGVDMSVEYDFDDMNEKLEKISLASLDSGVKVLLFT